MKVPEESFVRHKTKKDTANIESSKPSQPAKAIPKIKSKPDHRKNLNSS